MMMVSRSEMAMNSSTVFVGDWMLGLNMFGNTEIAMNRSNVFVGDWMPGLNMFGKTEMAMIMNIEQPTVLNIS